MILLQIISSCYSMRHRDCTEIMINKQSPVDKLSHGGVLISALHMTLLLFTYLKINFLCNELAVWTRHVFSWMGLQHNIRTGKTYIFDYMKMILWCQLNGISLPLYMANNVTQYNILRGTMKRVVASEWIKIFVNLTLHNDFGVL